MEKCVILPSSSQNYIDLTIDDAKSINNECITITDTADQTNQENQDVQNKTLIGLFLGIDNTYIPNINKVDGYLIYPEAKDFQLEISHQKALNSLFICNVDENQVSNYHWKSWQISNYYLFELLKEQTEFISIANINFSQKNI